MADNHFQAVGTPGTPTGTHLRLSSFWLYFMIYWSFRTIFFKSSIASVNQIFTSVLLLLELFLDKKTLSKKSWNPLEWLKQRKWNFLKYFVFIIFQRLWRVVGTSRMTLPSLGTHLAGINVIIGLIQILIVLIPPIWEIFQNKQHIRDAAA